MEEYEFFPLQEERRLLAELREEKDRKRREKIESELIHLYVRFGEHFKMSNAPDPQLAKKYLQKALKFKPSHPVANYRLAHICYNEGRYAEAAYHFHRALSGKRGESLNDTQAMLSHMLLVNCGIFLASNALKQMEKMEARPYDEETVDRYRQAIFLHRIEDFHRAFYRIITPESDEIVTEETYFSEQERFSLHEVMLCLSDGFVVRYAGELVELEYQSFYALATILHSERPMTGEDVRKMLFQSFFGRDVTDAAVRKMFERLRARIPFWDDIIETTRIGNKAARRRKQGVSYRIFCRASDIFPWE
ncbi:tetratricopeptide repeat protein [Caldibacillus debilis]|uniref:tetratricopeptide repeat protein n=1 Tax=Caldibacillus debilis TaxID=301148 RepID=UPI00035E5866|nr:tetratricopeptide repeat protein [Caldibacillus debilis]